MGQCQEVAIIAGKDPEEIDLEEKFKTNQEIDDKNDNGEQNYKGFQNYNYFYFDGFSRKKNNMNRGEDKGKLNLKKENKDNKNQKANNVTQRNFELKKNYNLTTFFVSKHEEEIDKLFTENMEVRLEEIQLINRTKRNDYLRNKLNDIERAFEKRAIFGFIKGYKEEGIKRLESSDKKDKDVQSKKKEEPLHSQENNEDIIENNYKQKKDQEQEQEQNEQNDKKDSNDNLDQPHEPSIKEDSNKKNDHASNEGDNEENEENNQKINQDNDENNEQQIEQQGENKSINAQSHQPSVKNESIHENLTDIKLEPNPDLKQEQEQEQENDKEEEKEQEPLPEIESINQNDKQSNSQISESFRNNTELNNTSKIELSSINDFKLDPINQSVQGEIGEPGTQNILRTSSFKANFQLDKNKFFGHLAESTSQKDKKRKKMVKSGYGIFKNRDGNTYEGVWTEDLLNGFGKLIDNNYTYKGEFNNTKKEGYCNLFANQFSYEGTFSNNLMNDFGIITKLDKHHKNEKYIGDIVNGKVEGIGKYIYGVNNYYFGEFKGETFNGVGIKQKENYKYEGYFKNGKKHGYGIETINDSNGNETIFSGHFENDKRNGFGKETNSDGEILYGRWENGRKIGLAKKLYKNSMGDTCYEYYLFENNKRRPITEQLLDDYEKDKNYLYIKNKNE